MKCFLAVLVAVLVLLPASSAHAITVWYQPTPYPLKKADGTNMLQSLNIVHGWDGWITNVYYNQAFVRDSRLQVGGWGDQYRTYLKWDLDGLPYNPTSAILLLRTYNTGTTSTPFAFCKVLGSWNLSMTWNGQPANPYCVGWYTQPTPGNLWAINFTPWYNEWKNGTVANNGIMLAPQNINNNFNGYRSSRYANWANDPYADGKRPILQFELTPTLELKMPLPGNHSWLVTNEIGGYECKGESPWPDTFHQDSTDNYFAIDFSWKNVAGTGGAVYSSSTSNIPILAAAAGTVTIGGGLTHPNGHYVVIDHGNGYTTRYLHLKTSPYNYVANNQWVSQGQQVGLMGTTGQDAYGNPTSTGVHLHFGVEHNGHSVSTSPELSKVVMDGLLLKSYQTECSVDANGVPTDRIRYYQSANTAY